MLGATAAEVGSAFSDPCGTLSELSYGVGCMHTISVTSTGGVLVRRPAGPPASMCAWVHSK